ncbi:hypothetical protein NYS55_15245 [Curtobacterium flaccumfaciens pv. flaccumfaciens]|uniref:hypothetical protein n=1 Tax=Curtobacterium flaccumfaciens TaxID=2035 RepID=UPI00217D83C2|nr:hypothetical protein [Curtobacterium flaccumfaciens]MCS6552786.1 hypothetical protein [Curtobacterium flaccumfaciens pv. flaccumfaciens]
MSELSSPKQEAGCPTSSIDDADAEIPFWASRAFWVTIAILSSSIIMIIGAIHAQNVSFGAGGSPKIGVATFILAAGALTVLGAVARVVAHMMRTSTLTDSIDLCGKWFALAAALWLFLIGFMVLGTDLG